jgi:hypothetical protein
VTHTLRLTGPYVTGITALALSALNLRSRRIAPGNEFATMMTYSFDKPPIYASGNAAAAWAVAGLLFALLVFA